MSIDKSNRVQFNLSSEKFATLFRNNYSSFCFFANRYVNNPLVAEDIVGDVALKFWEKIDDLKGINNFKSYFYTSIRNACINWIRKEQSQANQAINYKATTSLDEQTALENIIRTETFRELEAAIHTLPTQCRNVFLKLFVEGKTLSETAEEMGLSLSTIKNQRLRGIKLLRKQLIGPALLAWLTIPLF